MSKNYRNRRVRGGNKRRRRLLKAMVRPFPIHLQTLINDGYISSYKSLVETRRFPFVESLKTQLLRLEHLVRTFEVWKITLMEQEGPVYLALLIDPPYLYDTKIICAVGEKIADIQNNLQIPRIAKRFPYANQPFFDGFKVVQRAWSNKEYEFYYNAENMHLFDRLKKRAIGSGVDDKGYYLEFEPTTVWELTKT